MDKAVKFGKGMEEGFNLYKENLGILILVTFIAVILSVITFFVLTGPMMGGVLIITLALLDKKGPKPRVRDVFKGFDYFRKTFLFVIIWGVGLALIGCILVSLIPRVGMGAAIAFFIAAPVFLMFGPFLIVDKEMDFWSASMESFSKVKTNFWPLLALALVSGMIGGIGAFSCLLGLVFTLPIQACILTVAYRQVFTGEKAPADHAGKPFASSKRYGETAQLKQS